MGWSITQWTWDYYSTLWRTTWSLDTWWSINCSRFTNPVSTWWTYLQTSSLCNTTWQILWRTGNIVDNYRYGSRIPTQIRPVRWSGSSSIIPYGTDGVEYNTSRYIWQYWSIWWTFKINNNTDYTTTAWVTLTWVVSSASTMRFSNNWTNRSWRYTYQSTTWWNLWWWDGVRYVYSDYSGTAWIFMWLWAITLDATIPTVSTWYISFGMTWNNWSTLYYKWTINIRWDVSDAIWLSWATCQYTTWASRETATYNTTYCEVTNLTYTSDINIRFRIQDIAGNIWTWSTWTYVYDATASSTPTLLTPSNGTWLYTGNTTISWSTSTDAGIGLSGYYYQIATDAWFTSITNSWTTSSTSLLVSNLSYGTYYRRVYSFDKFNNTWSWSTTWNFTYINPLIIYYYGSWSTFTSNWTVNNCSLTGMIVTTLNPWTNTIWQLLTWNTIYVLNSWDYKITYATWSQFNGNCTTILWSGKVTVYSTWYIDIYWIFWLQSKQNNILDNISIDWKSNWVWGMHTWNKYWVFLWSSSNNTINNIQSYWNSYYWIYWYQSPNTSINNSKLYNNIWHWIYIEYSSNNTVISDTQSYNNASNWIFFYNNLNTSINNSQTYNNGNDWIAINTSFSGIINNSQTYNNGQYWVSISSSDNNNINNIQSYNNIAQWFLINTSINNKYYGIIKTFWNSADMYWTLTQWTWTYLSSLWRATWSLDTWWSMNCSRVTNPITTWWIYLQTWNLCNTKWQILWRTGNMADNYRYGSRTMTDIRPVRWSGSSSIIPYGTDWSDYNTSRYLWQYATIWWTFKINNNTDYATTSAVTLTWVVSSASTMRFSNNWTNRSWRYTYQSTTWWNLSWWEWLRYVYSDYSGAAWVFMSLWATTLDGTPPTVSTWYISIWATWFNAWYNYYKWTIDIRWDVSDTLWLSTSTCMYTTWASRDNATYVGTTTAWYCYKTWLNYTSTINIRFKIQDTAGSITTWWTWTYIYDATWPWTATLLINTWADYTNTWVVTLKINWFCPSDWWVWLSWIYIWNSPNPTTNFSMCSDNMTITWRSLSWWDWQRYVYIKWVDKLWNTWSDFNDFIYVDSASPQVYTAVIYSGTTWYNISISTFYFKWPIGIRSQVSDSVGISWATCEYNTWLSSRASSNYSGNGTDGYCLQTGLNYTSQITVNFRVRDVSNNLSTWNTTSYKYDATPPPAPLLYGPSNTWLVIDTGTTLLWDPSIDTGVGTTWYVRQLSTWSSFTTILNSWTVYTPTTLANINWLLDNTTYYWRVYAFDKFNNTWSWSEVWNFTVNTSINCLGTWNNDNFLTSWFWNTYTWDDQIICALYGSWWSDITAYTKNRQMNNCSPLSMNVVHLTWWYYKLPQTTARSTIYSLSSWSYISTWPINMSPCSAIVGQTWNITFYTTGTVNYQFAISWARNTIFDNLYIDWGHKGAGVGHVANTNWLKYSNSSSHNTVNNIKSYSNGKWLYFGDNSITIDINNSQFYENDYWIYYENAADWNYLTTSQIYNNTYWIYLLNFAYNSITDSQIFNNFYDWITYDNSMYNDVNNSQIYNNSSNWIFYNNGSHTNNINNTQVYNNSVVWIWYVGSTANIINNSQSYNNDYWLYYETSSDNIVNNSSFYNNSNWIDNISHDTNYYYGEIRDFSNFNDNTVGFVAWNGWDTIASTYFWSAGIINTWWTMSRDYITNPVDASWNYLLSRSGSFPDLLYPHSFVATIPISYSYWINTLTQIDPVMNVLSYPFVWGWWGYWYYIWSQITPRTMNYTWLSTWTNSVDQAVTVSSISPISKYSVFGNISPYKIWQNINTQTWISLVAWDWLKNTIAQIYNTTNYFAEHIQSTTNLDQTIPNLVFTWQTAANGTWQTSTTITWQMQIIESWLNQFIWTFNSTPYSIYDNGLVLMYNFDNVAALWETTTTIKDISKYNNTSTVGWATWTGNGKYNGAYIFNWGINNNIIVDNWIWWVGIDVAWAITLSMWIKPTSCPTAYYSLLNKDTHYWIELTTGCRLSYEDATNRSFDNFWYYNVSILSWVWNHIVVTKNASNFVSIYTNWIYQAGKTFGSTMNNVDSALEIWSYMWGAGFSWLIDEVRIYKRALTSWEAAQLYRSNLNKFDVTKYFFTTTYTWMADGTYYYTWKAIDFANNSSTTWRNLTIDTTAPMIVFTWSNPAQNATWTTNNFTWQMQITERWTWLGQFIYTFNSVPYSVYDSWLVAMYNFDNVSSLWETTSILKDMSQYWNNGTITSATRTWNGRWNGAYIFNWTSEIDIAPGTVLNSTLSWTHSWTISQRVNYSWTANYYPQFSKWSRSPLAWFTIHGLNWRIEWWNWTTWFDVSNMFQEDLRWKWWKFTIITYDGSMFKAYVDWILKWTFAWTNGIWDLSANGIIIWGFWWWMFNWSIDESRIYNRALSTWEIDLLYRSNLNKFNTWQWLFTDARMCMLNWSYNYTWYASDFLLNNYATGRTYNISITWYAIWVPWWINLWSVGVSFTWQTLSWQFTWYFSVQDDRGTTWWYTTIQLPWSFSWKTLSGIAYPSSSISISNIYFMWTWWVSTIAWTPATWIVYINNNVTSYVSFTWAKNYIKRSYPSNQYSCPAGTYGNKPWIKINIPASQSPDTYSGTIRFDINTPSNATD